MPSYVVTGASRGLGYEFIRQFSTIPDSIVIGLVRNVAATEEKVKADGLKNVHIIQGDVASQQSIESAVAQVAKITPVVDYLINNAAYIPRTTAFTALSDHRDDPALLEEDLVQTFQTNVVGVVRTINAFLPMVQKSSIKKVISIGTGLADDTLSNQYELYQAGPYSISKAGMNTVVAKYSAKHKQEGILFLSLSPGAVATNNGGAPPPDSDMPQKFVKAYPHFTGPITPEDSVNHMRDVIDRASADNKFAGAFVSHYGNKQWL